MAREFKRAWPTKKHRMLDERLHDAFEHAAALAAVEEISRVLDTAADPSEKFANIAEIARRVTHTDAAQIFLMTEQGTLRLEADTNEPDAKKKVELTLGSGLTGWAALHRKPVAIYREPWNDARYLEHPLLNERSFQSLLCVPLVAGDDLLGVVNVRTRLPYGYARREAHILSSIAHQVARAIQQQTEVERLVTKAAKFEAVSEVSGAIVQSPYLEEILQLLVGFTAERLNYKVVTVRLLDESRQELVLRATQSQNYAYRRKRGLHVGESFAGRAVVEKRSFSVPDVTENTEYVGADLAEEQGLKGMACVPLMAGDEPIGVMTCYTEDRHEFSKLEMRALEALAQQAALAIEHARLKVRNTLMQEMHHRMKNSLQQVASLLRLQLADGGHKTVEEALSDVLNRLTAIAGVHDLLSREDLDRVGVISIAEALASHQQMAMMLPKRFVPISIGGDDVPLGMTQATQVALILNELVQNAVQHGFRNFEEGEICIRVRALDDEVKIWVSNSGSGLPDDFELALDSHLGLKIVTSLAGAIGAKFSLGRRFKWVVAELRLPTSATG